MSRDNGTALATQDAPMLPAELAEKVFVGGDLSKLSPGERLNYYTSLCTSLGLNPATRPFEYITLSGKLTLYARKDATEQLRKRDTISIPDLQTSVLGDIYVVKATAYTPGGRSDTSIGAVSVKGLSGEALANAMMKAETKAKRRVTLSICGLGMLDETEVETIPQARPVQDVTPVQPQDPAPEPPQAAPDNRPALHSLNNEFVRLGLRDGAGVAFTDEQSSTIVKIIQELADGEFAAVGELKRWEAEALEELIDGLKMFGDRAAVDAWLAEAGPAVKLNLPEE